MNQEYSEYKVWEQVMKQVSIMAFIEGAKSFAEHVHDDKMKDDILEEHDIDLMEEWQYWKEVVEVSNKTDGKVRIDFASLIDEYEKG